MSSNDSRRAPHGLGWLVAAGIAGAAGPAFTQPTTVSVVEPTRRDIALRSIQPGTAEAYYEADLGAKVSGHVSELNVDIGTSVVEGQVLARITVPELIQSRNAAAAEVSALESERERIAALVERNSMTRASLTEAQSRVDVARARQAGIEAEMSYATIEAPFDGIVTARTIDPGDMVFQASSPKGGDQPLFRVAKIDVIRLTTYVPERAAAWIDIGDPASVSFDAIAGRAFEGAVTRIAGTLDPATRTMQVEIDLDNADGSIRPGYYGQTRILLEERSEALALPAAAVRIEDGKASVFVVTGETARRVPVSLGVEDAGWIEIAAGLTGGERIVTGAAVRQLSDGASVAVAAR